MNRLTFIHTASWHAERFRDLAQRTLPDWSSYAVVDESLLLDTIERGEVSPKTVQRLAGHVLAAAEAGASAVVVTCSSLGSAVDAMRSNAPVPLFRIDRGMAEAAVRSASRIGILATLPTTLSPTAELLSKTAATAGRRCEIFQYLCDGAFAKLTAGDRAAHDDLVREGFTALAGEVDLIVLAQASMAGAIGPSSPCPYLTSTEIGLEQIARQLLTA